MAFVQPSCEEKYGPPRPFRESMAGFTMVELLVAVAILAVLASLLLPAVDNARRKADMAKCAGNLRGISVAWASYSSDNGRLNPTLTQDVTWDKAYWICRLAPYLGLTNVSINNKEYLKSTACPSNDGKPLHTVHSCGLSYLPNIYCGGEEVLNSELEEWPGNTAQPRTRMAAIQTPSKFLVAACSMPGIERNSFSAVNPLPYWSDRHSGGANALFADGHVKLVVLPPTEAEKYKVMWPMLIDGNN